MKRFIAVLSSLLVLPAFAEVAPIAYDDYIEYSDVEYLDGDVDADVVEMDTESEETDVPAPVIPTRVILAIKLQRVALRYYFNIVGATPKCDLKQRVNTKIGHRRKAVASLDYPLWIRKMLYDLKLT